MMTKAQASMEVLIFLGLVLLFTVPVIMGLFLMSKGQVEQSGMYQARIMATLLADKMLEIDSQTYGNTTVELMLPQGTTNITFNQVDVDHRPRSNNIVFTLEDSSGAKQIAVTTYARVAPGQTSITGLSGGRLLLEVSKNKGNYVNVTKIN